MTPQDRRAEQEQERLLAQQTEEDDTRWLMADARGRRLMRAWLASAGVYRTTFVPGDSHASAFNEGRRAVGLMLQAQVLQHSPEAYVRMLLEGGGSLKPLGGAETAPP